jgi:isopentenyldiphosphate isomerase
MAEYFEIYDHRGNATGKRARRNVIHSRGLWHRTVHVWIYNTKRNILFQKRAMGKDSHPGLWDVSAAGHVEIGENPVNAATREIKEELGIEINDSELEYIDTRKFVLISNNNTFIDREITDIYLLRGADTAESYLHDREEVEDVQYFPINKVKKLLYHSGVSDGFVPHDLSYYTFIFHLIENRDV